MFLCLSHAQFAALLEQADQLGDALLAGLLAFGVEQPEQVNAALAGRQALKGFGRGGAGLQGPGKPIRQVGFRAARGRNIFVEDFGRDARQHLRLDAPRPLPRQFAQALAVGFGPFGPVFTRGEFLDVFFIVDTLDDAVDPAAAQRLFDRVVVGDARLAGVSLVENQPDLALAGSVLFQPGAPFGPVRDEQGFG